MYFFWFQHTTDSRFFVKTRNLILEQIVNRTQMQRCKLRQKLVSCPPKTVF